METEDHNEMHTEGAVTGPILPVLFSYKFVGFTDRVCGGVGDKVYNIYRSLDVSSPLCLVIQ